MSRTIPDKGASLWVEYAPHRIRTTGTMESYVVGRTIRVSLEFLERRRWLRYAPIDPRWPIVDTTGESHMEDWI